MGLSEAFKGNVAPKSFIKKPIARHPNLPRNDLGLTRRDYEGALSTLCAGCGHDSVSSAIIEACFQLSKGNSFQVRIFHR